jgi:purine-binding chemotaxis protein CheW
MDSSDRKPDRASGSRLPEELRELLQEPDALFPWETTPSPPPSPEDFPVWEDAAPAAPAPSPLPDWWLRDEPPLPGGPIEEPDLESDLPSFEEPPLDRTLGPTHDTIPIFDLPRLLEEMSPVPGALLHDLTKRPTGSDARLDGPPAFAENAASEGDQYLVFHLAGAEYAIALANVREIAHAPLITPLPRVPAWLLGVCNVRGDIVSVVDLRLFLQLPESGPQRAGRLLVVASRREQVTTGLRIDAVREIIRVPQTALSLLTRSSPPKGGEGRVRGDEVEPRVQLLLQGITQRGSRRLRVLDIERFLLSEELRQFEPV